MHRVLERQIKRALGALSLADTSPEWLALLKAVSETYEHADEDRRLLSRSLDLSSEEFVEINKKLHSENEIIEQKVRDRTEELTKANVELKELDQRKSEFLLITTHQLRTPLSGLKWALDMLIAGQAGPISNEQKALLMKSYEGNERMIGLVNEMLKANQIDVGTFTLQTVSTQMLDLIDKVISEASLHASKMNITIVFDHRGITLPPLIVDPEKMRASFQNLLDNAIKYSRPGGEILISASQEGNKIQFAIQDHGIGIPTSEQDHIFSRFFRASNAMKMDPNGSGLGLYIVKSIVEKHGGKIWFTSEENKGTTFYCVFTI